MENNTLNERIVILETKVVRIVSDIESEQAARVCANAHLDGRLLKLERVVYMATGALGVLQILLTFFRH